MTSGSSATGARTSASTRLVDAWVDHPSWDLALALVFAAAVGLVQSHVSVLVSLDASSRAVLYQTLAGISGAFLAFGLTPLAIILALSPGPRLEALLVNLGDRVRSAFIKGMLSLLTATALFVTALAVDTGSHTSTFARYGAVFAAGLAFLGIARIIEVFRLLLAASGKDITGDRADRLRTRLSEAEPPVYEAVS